MSITAFPVLARIMTEQKLLNTDVGQMTLAAAGTDDAIAWCLLILVVALINNPSQAVNALYVFLIIIAFGAFLWFAVRPIILWLVERSDHDSGADQFNVFVVFVIMCLAAFFTGAAGVETIFGAFLGIQILFSNE
jgi:Kef-type K+ transport system membrane component KefB